MNKALLSTPLRKKKKGMCCVIISDRTERTFPQTPRRGKYNTQKKGERRGILAAKAAQKQAFKVHLHLFILYENQWEK